MAKSKLKDKPKPTEPQSNNPPPDQSEEKPNTETAEKISAEQPPSNKDKNEVVDNTEKISDEIQSTEKQNTEAAAISKSDAPDTEPSDKTDEKKDTTDENKDQPVSETIRKMTSSPANLPGDDTLTSKKKPPTDSTHSSTISAKDIMQKNILWASPDDTVQHALTNMQQHDTGYMMVGTDGSLEGILSKSDITGAISPYLRPIFAKWQRPIDEASLQIKIKWIMTRPVQTITPDTPIEQIMENICQFGHRALPVVDQQGKVHGLVTVFDIFQTVLKTNSNLSTVGKVNQAPPLT